MAQHSWGAGTTDAARSAGTSAIASGSLDARLLGAPVECRHLRLSVADLNTGGAMLPPLVSRAYRLVDATAIAYGLDAAACTSIILAGTKNASAVTLVAFGQAALTRSVLVRAGDTGAPILGDGGAFEQMDQNTAITYAVVGDPVTGLAVDLMVWYTISAELDTEGFVVGEDEPLPNVSLSPSASPSASPSKSPSVSPSVSPSASASPSASPSVSPSPSS